MENQPVQAPDCQTKGSQPFHNRLISVFDTTLRDGEQSPGGSMSAKQKLKIALQLSELGVDVIEAGFPIVSPGDFQAVKLIAEQVKNTTICALARAIDKDIEVAAEALASADKKRIHLFIATSDIHLQSKLKMSRQQALLAAVAATKKAKSLVDEVEFSAEDAARTDFAYLKQVLEAVIDAGASIVNIPDTVGYATPAEFGQLIYRVKHQVANIERVKVSVHCHDDLGLATANSLAAIENGADQVECTINGIGERAGNCPLEELVMALKVRNQHFGAITRVKTRLLLKTSRMVSTTTGIPVQPNKAIIGDNAFAHEAGIHQHGVLENPMTYEIMQAEEVGFSSNELVIGKHSGRHAIRRWLQNHQLHMTPEQLEAFFAHIKQSSDQGKRPGDPALMAIFHQITTPQTQPDSSQYLRSRRW